MTAEEAEDLQHRAEGKLSFAVDCGEEWAIKFVLYEKLHARISALEEQLSRRQPPLPWPKI